MRGPFPSNGGRPRLGGRGPPLLLEIGLRSAERPWIQSPRALLGIKGHGLAFSRAIPRSVMITIARSRGVAFIVEQPLNSLLFNAPGVIEQLQCRMSRVVSCMGALGGSSMKPLELWGSMSQHLFKTLVRSKR